MLLGKESAGPVESRTSAAPLTEEGGDDDVVDDDDDADEVAVAVAEKGDVRAEGEARETIFHASRGSARLIKEYPSRRTSTGKALNEYEYE